MKRSFFLQIAREHSIPFLETSAKSNINVEKAFMDLAQAILNKVQYLREIAKKSKRVVVVKFECARIRLMQLPNFEGKDASY